MALSVVTLGAVSMLALAVVAVAVLALHAAVTVLFTWNKVSTLTIVNATQLPIQFFV